MTIFKQITHAIGLCLIIQTLSFSATGQDNTHGFEATAFAGYLLPHRQTMRHLPEHVSRMAEFRYVVQTTGAKAWESSYLKPRYGASLRIFDLGNYDLLGFGIGFTGFTSLPVIKREKFTLHFEMGGGLGWITKPYDEVDNQKNVAIGSHINFYPWMGWRAEYRLSNMVLAHVSASFNHFSNGHLTLPNMGINYPMVGAGISIIPEVEEVDIAAVSQKRQGRWAVILAGSIKENASVRNVKHPVAVLRLERILGVSEKSEFGLGIDAMFNSARISSLEGRGDTLNSTIQNTQIGFNANYHLGIGKVTMIVGGGLFLYTAFPDFRSYYNRAGIRYDFLPGWALNATIKTYLFRADYFEIGLVKYF